MKRYALIQDNVVVNVIQAEEIEGLGDTTGYTVVEDVEEKMSPGDQWQKFLPLPATTLRLTLLATGIFPSQVVEAINYIPDKMEREQALIMWEYATEYHRHHPLIDQMGTVFGLTSEQVDAMWRQAEATL